jgi:TPR repeat protein
MRCLKTGILSATILTIASAGASAQERSVKPDAAAAGAPGLSHDITLSIPLSPEVDPAVTDEAAYIAAQDWPEKGARGAERAGAPRDAAVKAGGAGAMAVLAAQPDETAAPLEPLTPPDADATADDLEQAASAPANDPAPARLPDDIEAAYKQGLALNEGRDGATDPAAAARAFRRAATAGHPGAAFELGWAYEAGQGVEPSLSQAAAWYQRAVAGGDTRAMNNLGWLYAQGRGVNRDVARAADLYRAAAEAGEPSAMGNLGWLMENGIGMAQDLRTAAHWYIRAAEAGDTQSMLNLGNLYLVGDGVPQNPATALGWFARARAAGRAEALSYIGEVFEKAPEMRDADRAAAFYVRALEAGDGWPERRASAAWDADTAVALQRLLAERAVYDGPIDGQIGPGSRRAMRALMEAAAAR